MPICIVEVMPKPEILDPQGKAIAAGLARAGDAFVAEVRMGKRFEIAVDGEASDERLTRIREIAEETLANTVIEHVVSVHWQE